MNFVCGKVENRIGSATRFCPFVVSIVGVSYNAASVTVGIAFVGPNVRRVVSFGAANVTELIASVGVGVIAGLSCLCAYVAKLVAFAGVGVLAVSLSLKAASVTYVIALA